MRAATLVPFAQAGFSVGDVLNTITTAASLLAIVGLILVLPLYLTQRREVQRLLLWQRLEPQRGGATDEPQPAETTAVGPPRAPAAAGGAAPAGRLTPAQRVTADRPALERITAERAALESPSFWRRFIAGGPRHPLVLSGIAVLLAAGAVAAWALLGSGDEPRSGGGLERADVPVAVLNASSQTGLAGRMADLLRAEGFERIETGTTATANQSIVLFNNRRRREARAVARELNVSVVQPVDRVARAAAPEAAVVVVVGEDHARR